MHLECIWHVLRMLVRCFNNALRMHLGWIWDGFRMHLGCIWVALGMLVGCFRNALRIQLGCIESLVMPGKCISDALRMLGSAFGMHF